MELLMLIAYLAALFETARNIHKRVVAEIEWHIGRDFDRRADAAIDAFDIAEWNMICDARDLFFQARF